MSLFERFAPRWYDARTDRIIAAREAVAERDLCAELRFRWMTAVERPQLQLSHAVSNACGVGPGRAPLIREITIGDAFRPTTFTVELRPGQVLEDLEDVGQELAAALQVHRLRFEPLGGPFVRVTMVESDPHAGVVDMSTALPGHLTIGPDEVGEPVMFSPAESAHWGVQGQTRSGKSILLYHLMKQIITMPGSRLAGIDPSGVLFRALPDDPLRCSTLADPSAIVSTLAALVDEMTARLERLPVLDDRLPCGPGLDPWLWVVLEELPGLLAGLEAVDTKLAKLAKLYVGRLTAEGAKVGVRCVLAAQRFEAQSVGGAVVRSNCPVRVSFRCENATSIQFLHESASPDVVADHLEAPAGIALVSSPGSPLRRVRVPHVNYAEWAVAAQAATADVAAAAVLDEVAA